MPHEPTKSDLLQRILLCTPDPHLRMMSSGFSFNTMDPLFRNDIRPGSLLYKLPSIFDGPLN